MIAQILLVSLLVPLANLVTVSPVEESCRTAWFDDGDVTSAGDQELLSDLMNNHRGGICQHPVDMEAQTISGIKSNHTKNTFFSYNHIVGLVCLNSEQTKRLCEDYKVMFTCTGGFCSDCRTDWFDIDDPSGNGDYELLSELLALSPREVCASPLAMEAQTLSGTPASLTGDIFQVYDATYGFACVNADQSSGKCKDYRVRFTCPAEFCSVSQECRTGWFNSDNPSGIGDVESLSQLLQTYPDRICHNPISIFVKTVAGISAEHTGDKFLTNDVTFGFACINADQRKRSKMCEDYQVMFACPSDFCQVTGCKTRWFDFDNPDGNGDFERLSQLQSDFPDEICSEPLGIEAVTVSGTPALQTKNVFQVYDATHGFACVNSEQRQQPCEDYKVRYTCPPQFCAHKPGPMAG